METGSLGAILRKPHVTPVATSGSRPDFVGWGRVPIPLNSTNKNRMPIIFPMAIHWASERVFKLLVGSAELRFVSETLFIVAATGLRHGSRKANAH